MPPKEEIKTTPSLTLDEAQKKIDAAVQARSTSDVKGSSRVIWVCPEQCPSQWDGRAALLDKLHEKYGPGALNGSWDHDKPAEEYKNCKVVLFDIPYNEAHQGYYNLVDLANGDGKYKGVVTTVVVTAWCSYQASMSEKHVTPMLIMLPQ